MVKRTKGYGHDFGLIDLWREQHHNTICITWSNGTKDITKRVRTRIDRILADMQITDRVIDIQIMNTNVSDHDAIT